MIRLNIRDTMGRLIELDCDPNWKLATLINEYKVKHEAKYGNVAKKTILFTFNGEDLNPEDDENLNEIDLEDGVTIVAAFLLVNYLNIFINY